MGIGSVGLQGCQWIKRFIIDFVMTAVTAVTVQIAT